MSSLRADLLAWFDRHHRDLPWRRTKEPYAIWLSEVMLQQTQVATVIPYWERFRQRFPTVAALAASPLPEVFALWKGLGYYSRARNLHRAAQAIVERHAGELPASASGLLELPGFGRYTAGAVASIAFGEAAPLVDGNVARVFSRLFEVEGSPGARDREAKLWALAEQWVQGARPGDWNQALMELGATVCRPVRPDCARCPVRAHCRALAHGRVDELPPPRVRPAKQRLRLAVAVWRRGDALLFARRAEGGLFGGLWELPSAEVPQEATASELGRALRAVLGEVSVGDPLGSVRRTLTHRELTLELLEVAGRRTRFAHPSVQEWRWADADEAEGLGMSTAMAKALALARDALSSPQRPAAPVSRRGPGANKGSGGRAQPGRMNRR